jgi:hypothetical protein
MNQHHAKCSFSQTDGGLLCDCEVITKHPEYLDEILQTTDGIPYMPNVSRQRPLPVETDDTNTNQRCSG